jgi:hypothetical protein
MIIQGYKITSNHATGVYPAHMRVKSPAGVLVARVQGKRGDVLSHIRKNFHSAERIELVRQLTEAYVPQEVIAAILDVPQQN